MFWKNKQKHWSTWQAVILGSLVWLGVLVSTAAVADYFFAYSPSFPYARELLGSRELPRYFYSFANFDGVHYLTIAERGYHAAALIQAFFPLYPSLLAIAHLLGLETLRFGILLNWLLLPVLAFVLYKLFLSVQPKENARFAILALAVFPTSFFFACLYTETMFCILVAGTFLAAGQKRWWLAVVLAAAASATRLVGIFLLPAVLCSWPGCDQHTPKQVWQFIRAHWWRGGFIMFAATGLVAYMVYLQWQFQDPLLFIHVQSEFGSGREETIVLLPQTLWRSIKIVTTVPVDFKWWSYLQDLVLTGVVGGTLGVGLLQTLSRFWNGSTRLFGRLPALPLSWYVFCVPAILLPTATGTLSSMPRYLLVALPFFVILAQLIQTKRQRVIYGILSIAVLLFNWILFVQGYWVA